MFSNRLSQLSFDAQVMMFMGDNRHAKKLKLVKWALLEYHPDQYRLQVDSLTLPRGKGITEKAMMQDDVVMALSATAQKPVASHWVNGVGLYFLVDREHGIGNVPKFCDYDTILKNSKASKVSLTQIPIGFSGNRQVVYLDFSADTQAHLLIGGTSGGGKSSLLQLLISHLIQYDPAAVKLSLFDFKRVELRPFYRTVPHLMHDVVVDPTVFVDYIQSIQDEVARRYRVMEEANVQHIKEYNARRDLANRLPEIFVIVDELAAIFTNPHTRSKKDDVEAILGDIAMQARACGVHLILSTQRPDSHVLTGYIRACMPCKIAFACASATESILIIGNGMAAFRSNEPVGRAVLAKSRFHIPFQAAWLSKQRRREIIELAGAAVPPELAVAKSVGWTVPIEEMAQYAMDNLDWNFHGQELYNEFSGRGMTYQNIWDMQKFYSATPFEIDGYSYILKQSKKRQPYRIMLAMDSIND